MKLDEAQIAPYTATPLPAVAGPWLVFAPHADDESFGMGGSIALAAQAGIAVHLVVLTDGALGGTQHDLVAIRKQEAQQAVQIWEPVRDGRAGEGPAEAGAQRAQKAIA